MDSATTTTHRPSRSWAIACCALLGCALVTAPLGAQQLHDHRAAPAVDPVPAPERLDRIVARLDAREDYSLALSQELELLFREAPEVMDLVPAMLLAGDVTSDTADVLVLGLEKVGSPDAQRLIGDIQTHGGQRHLDRLRATMALGAVSSPTDETVALLWSAAQRRFDPRAVDLSNTSLLSLGAIGGNFKRTEPSRYPALRGALLTSLRETQSTQERVILLKAVANLQDPALRGEVEAHLFDASAPVRASAAQSLAVMGSEGSREALLTALDAEPKGIVRAAFLASLRSMPATDVSLRTVHARVLAEPHPEARAEMVSYLLANLDRIEEARPTLRHLFLNDPTKRIRMLAAAALVD